MNKQCLVQVTDIKKAYQLGNTSLMALRGVSVAVRKGEVIGLYGRSGSGKTTLLNAMGLVETIDEGEIAFQGRNVCGLSDASLAEIRNRSMGFIFQNFNLIPVLNAFENVEYPLLLARVGKRERNARVVEVLAAVGLEKHMAHRPDELSGGQRQRVAIARALVNKPDVVFADEATSALDKKTSIEVMELCKQINAQTGTTFVFSSHDDIVASYCHRVIEISDGELVDKAST